MYSVQLIVIKTSRNLQPTDSWNIVLFPYFEDNQPEINPLMLVVPVRTTIFSMFYNL